MRIAIVGAGMAGIAAADSLQRAGFEVIVFDKSRGVGGRLATRRVDDFRFDHGAPSITTVGSSFASFIQDRIKNGRAAVWTGDHHVGLPGMSGLLKDVAGNLSIHKSHRVHSVSVADDRLELTFEDALQSQNAFDAAIFAAPAPQTEAILEASTMDIPPTFFERLQRVDYDPCWTLMFTLHDREANALSDLPASQTFDQCTIHHETTKPDRPRGHQAYVVHASPRWSRDNLELDADRARDALLKLVKAQTGLDPTSIDYATAHRWRYANVSTSANVDCLWDAQSGLGACGDWCAGRGVEGAYESGIAVAQRVRDSFLA